MNDTSLAKLLLSRDGIDSIIEHENKTYIKTFHKENNCNGCDMWSLDRRCLILDNKQHSCYQAVFKEIS
jgi:hypothetical protein